MSVRLAKSIITIVKRKFHNGKSRKNGSKKRGTIQANPFSKISALRDANLCNVFMFLFFYCFIKGCYQKSNIGNTEIKNGIETEKTDSLDLVSHITSLTHYSKPEFSSWPWPADQINGN